MPKKKKKTFLEGIQAGLEQAKLFKDALHQPACARTAIHMFGIGADSPCAFCNKTRKELGLS